MVVVGDRSWRLYSLAPSLGGRWRGGPEPIGRSSADKGQARRHVLLCQAMQDQRPREAAALQQRQVQRVIQEATSRRKVSGFAIMVQIFGMRERDVGTEQGE